MLQPVCGQRRYLTTYTNSHADFQKYNERRLANVAVYFKVEEQLHSQPVMVECFCLTISQLLREMSLGRRATRCRELLHLMFEEMRQHGGTVVWQLRLPKITVV